MNGFGQKSAGAAMSENSKKRPLVEWPTALLLLLCYGVWGLATTGLVQLSLTTAVIVTGLAIAMFSSLQHEVLHGHPFRSAWISEAVVFPALTIAVPYLRFRDSHLEHHRDERLTDPYDDPESNFLDPAVWQTTPLLTRLVLLFNNTLMGRLTIGVLVSQVVFMRADWCAIRAGNRQVLMGWIWHVPSLIVLGLWLGYMAQMPVWAYFISAYIGLSIVKIRTFLEHRAHDLARARTVLIEDRGPLAFLFLNNNLHVVHHTHPRMPWYALPKQFADNKDHYLKRNDSYYYRSYWQVFRAYFFHAKDPIAHPLWPQD